MADADKDDEHYAPESGEREADEATEADTDTEEHDKDDEHYAPES